MPHGQRSFLFVDFRLIKLKGVMERTDCQFCILRIDNTGDFDLRSRDHADIDSSLAKAENIWAATLEWLLIQRPQSISWQYSHRHGSLFHPAPSGILGRFEASF